MRQAITFASMMLIGVFLSSLAVEAYTPHAGMRVTLDNKFLHDTTNIVIPKVLEMIHQMIHPPNNFSFGINLWPFKISLMFMNFNSTVLKQDASKATFEPSNGGFLLRLPLIKQWDIGFEYNYNSTFVDNRKEKALLHFEDFCFELAFKFTNDNYMNIMNINLQMGKSRLTFSNPPVLFSVVSFFFNNLQPIYTFMVNSPLKWMLNIVTYFMPIPVQIPIMGAYTMDMSPIYKMLIDANNAIMYMRGELVNTVKSINPDESTPTDLQKVPVDKDASVEIMLNEHLVGAAFSTLAKSGDLKVVITDEQVFNLTKFLHLRTTDFGYFIPGLQAKFGDKKMQLGISHSGAVPTMQIFKNNNEIRIIGSALVDFLVDGFGSALSLIMDADLSLSARTDNKSIYAKINEVALKDVKISTIKIDIKPDVATLKKEFNTLFKFVVNAANIYALEAPIHLPDELPLDIITLLVKAVNIKVLDGAFGIGVKLAIKK